MSSIQFREIVRRQFEVYFAAARQLLELICIGLDIDQSKFDNLLENHASTFRLIHNPPRHDIIPEGMPSHIGIILKIPLGRFLEWIQPLRRNRPRESARIELTID